MLVSRTQIFVHLSAWKSSVSDYFFQTGSKLFQVTPGITSGQRNVPKQQRELIFLRFFSQ